MGNVYREAIEAPSDRVIVALDNMGWNEAKSVMDEVAEHVGMGKANSLAQRGGWDNAVNQLSFCGVKTMADAKYKDIPQTMYNHLNEVTRSTPRLVTVFADNTKESLEYAVRGRNKAREDLLEKNIFATRAGGILGVTVLTSIDTEQCMSIYGDEPEKKVLQFARTAMEAGLDGIVCSGKELEAIRKDDTLSDLVTVVPGITPEWTTKATDQKRVVTPKVALESGADYLVIGRAITKPPEGMSRVEAAQRIEQEIAEAL